MGVMKYLQNIDGHFVKGRSHIVCEDYVFTDSVNEFMVVADGCSTGEFSDIASRILIHSCKKTLRQLFQTESGLAKDSVISHKLLGDMILSSSKIVAETLGFDHLLSTMIVSFIHGDKVYTYFYGDGFLVVKYEGVDILEIHKVDFTLNAPNYLWYRSNPNKYVMMDNNLLNVDGDKRSPHDEVSFVHNVNDIEFLAIFTDGISSSVRDKIIDESKFGSSITESVAIHHLTDFKSTGGEFIKRRLNRFVKDTTSSGFSFDDDIGYATMIFSS